MTKPQVIYLVIVGVYFCLFSLFARYLYYRHYANTKYWKKEPKMSLTKIEAMSATLGKQMPHFSIMIPAKNEAAVIEKTMQHMSTLNYPNNKYQVIIVTDQKEINMHEQNKKKMVKSCLRTIQGSHIPELGTEENRLLLGTVSYVLLSQCLDTCGKYVSWLSPTFKKNQHISWKRVELLTDFAESLTNTMGSIKKRDLYKCFTRLFPQMSREQIDKVLPQYIALSLPVIAITRKYRGDHNLAKWQRLIGRVGKTNHWMTKEIINELAIIVTKQLDSKLQQLQAQDVLENIITKLYSNLMPTTQKVIERWLDDNKDKDIPVFDHHIVPIDFDGLYQGKRLGEVVKSTKGRALNFALPYLPEQSVMCGFYDAESRPEKNVLLHVAYRCLKDGSTGRILQGPIFQVRNFYDMSPFSKVASLYQSVAHDWALPVTYKTIPFVGGTNVYVSEDLLKKLKGYDHMVLTEDLELGTRAFLETGVWPEYLPCATSEQTPPVFKAFYRQRLRWGTGHLQVIDKVKNSAYPQKIKKKLLRHLLLKGPIEWSFYQIASFLPAVVFILYLVGIIDPAGAPLVVKVLLVFMTFTYIGFTYFCFLKYRRFLDTTAEPHHILGKTGALLQLLFLPVAAFFFPVPFSSALILKKFDRHPTTWTKTPRTKE